MGSGYEPARSYAGPRLHSAPFAMPARVTPPDQSIAQEVGRFFRDLRQAFRLSHAQVASRVATRIDIVMALEAGNVHALPPWDETCRIVRAYTQFAGLDPRPVLKSLEVLLAAAATAPASQTQRGGVLPRVSHKQAAAPETRRTRARAGIAEGSSDRHNGRTARTARLLVAAAVPVALVVLVTQTSVLEAAVSKLPPSVARIVRGAQNYVIVQMAPVRDGLRWIDVPDPRTRRGDKLQTASQSD